MNVLTWSILKYPCKLDEIILGEMGFATMTLYTPELGDEMYIIDPARL